MDFLLYSDKQRGFSKSISLFDRVSSSMERFVTTESTDAVMMESAHMEEEEETVRRRERSHSSLVDTTSSIEDDSLKFSLITIIEKLIPDSEKEEVKEEEEFHTKLVS
jgi:hypothetical protein